MTIKLLGMNAFAEAMFYYFGVANNEGVKIRLEKAVKRHPECKKMLEKAAKPAAMLEKLLESKLSADSSLIDKYFKKIDGINPRMPLSISLAFAMIYSTVINHTEYTPKEMSKYLRRCSKKERIGAFCLGLMTKREILGSNDITIEEFARRVENLPISSENKWKILDACVNYKPHIEELLSIIMPAAKIIEDAADKNLTKEFYTRYGSNDAQMLFDIEPELKSKAESIDIVKVVPLILRFENIYNMIETTDTDAQKNGCTSSVFVSTCRMFIGIACHIVSNAAQNEELTLSEKLKIISDNTRLEMLFYLCSHKAYGQELCSKFDLHHSTISYHIAKLLSADFITAELMENQIYYTADKAGIQRMLDTFAEKIK